VFKGSVHIVTKRKIAEVPMAKAKVLAVVPGICKGCHRCELYCSFYHFEIHSMFLAGLRVRSANVNGAISVPSICIDCGRCMEACPIAGAMKRDPKLGIIKVTDKCTGCGQCVPACPFDLIRINPDTRKAVKCDCCDGDPECVKHCPYHALVYVDVDKAIEFTIATRLI